MDISALKPLSIEIEILHPATKENIGVRVEICSFDDDKITKHKRKILNDRLQLEQRGKNFKAEDIESNLQDLLFMAIVSWDWYGDADFQGEKPELNRVNVFKVFKEIPWFKDQLSEAVNNSESFFQG